MSDDPQVAQAHQEVATRNAQAAVEIVNELKAEYDQKLLHMAQLIGTLNNKLSLLEQKYNLLLTQRFNHGSTSGE